MIAYLYPVVVDDHAIQVDEDIIPDVDVIAIDAIKRGPDCDILADTSQHILQHGSPIILRIGIVICS
jgi:hypothetical protein